MATSFLSQLLPPRGPRRLLSRERLLAPLLAALDLRVITLIAAGGSGKTSLLVDLQRRLDMPLAWLRLDEWERDPLELAGAMAGALEPVVPGVSAAVEAALGEGTSEELRLRRAALSMLRCTATVPRGVLVLDDVHVLADQPRAANLLNQVLANMPAGWCTVLAGRRLPAISCLSTMELEGDLFALPPETLALTCDETGELLRQLGLALPDDRVDSLWRESGGWAAAVVLRAPVLAAGGDTGARSTVQPPPGSAGTAVFDYLARTVFAEIDVEERALLHRAALPRTLDERSFALVRDGEQTGSGEAASTITLATLAGRHVFITREQATPAGEFVYRMHDLFRDFLLAESTEQSPKLVKRLHRALGSQSVEREQRSSALYHFRAAEAWEELTAAAQRSISRMRGVGRWRSIIALVDWLPPEALALDPSLRLQRAESFNYLNQPHDTLAELTALESTFVDGGDRPSRAAAHVLRGTALRLLGSLNAAVDECRTGERMLLELDAPISQRARAQRLLGTALAVSGRLQEAMPVLKQALQVFEALGDVAEQSLTHDTLAGALLHLGKAAEAATHLESARRGWHSLQNGGSLALTLNNLGLAYAALGDLELAAEILEQSRREAEAADQERIAVGAVLSLAEVRRDQGDAQAMAALGLEALRRARAGDQPYHVLHALLALAEAHRQLGDWERAESLAREATGIASEQAGSFEQGLAALALGRALCATGSRGAALTELRRAVAVLDGCGAGRELVRARFVLAAELRRAGEESEAAALHSLALAACEAINDRVLLAQFGGRLGVNVPISQPGSDFPSDTSRTDPGGGVGYPGVTARMFGRLLVEVGGKEPDDALWHGDKSKELLFFLLANPGGISKGAIYDALWPEADSRTCRNNLNTTVYRLRRAVYHEAVITTRETCRLNPGGTFWFDVAEFNSLAEIPRERSMREAGEAERLRHIERAATLYLGPIDSSPLGDWAERLRHECEHRYLLILSDLASAYFGAGDHVRAAGTAERGLAIDPTCEPLVRIAFESELVAGRMLEALRRFRAYLKLLQAEGLHPSHEFGERYLEVRSGGFRIGPAARSSRSRPARATALIEG